MLELMSAINESMLSLSWQRYFRDISGNKYEYTIGE